LELEEQEELEYVVQELMELQVIHQYLEILHQQVEEVEADHLTWLE
jgi:hypothetical protein